MSQFNGFYPQSTEVLMGIRFNNNKEYFHENKKDYDEYLTKPLKIFAEGLLEKFKELDKDFDDEVRISRPNRDIRFSSNKMPYKESKWFFLRKDKISVMEYNRPNYFFEIRPEGYLYGMGYWGGSKLMKAFREYSMNNPKEFSKMLHTYKKQNNFELDGDLFKKTFYPDRTEEENNFLQRKTITLIKKKDNDTLLYKEELLQQVFEELSQIHSIYKYLMKVQI